jgi:hypothetical protein
LPPAPEALAEIAEAYYQETGLRGSASIVQASMAAILYRCELRRSEDAISRSHLTQDWALEVGERIDRRRARDHPGGRATLRRAEFRLVVQLWREGVAS